MQKIKNVGKIILAKIYFSWLSKPALNKIKKERVKLSSPENVYAWTKDFFFGIKIRGLNINFKSSQVKEEILGLASFLKEKQPKVVVEIGTATGGTLFVFTSISSPEAKIISIDLPFGRYGAGYLKYRIPLLKAFATEKQEMELLRLDSHLLSTFNKLEEALDGKLIDFLFIDGDHSYQGVKQDFEMYKKLVRPGGFIAFHDIIDNDFDKSFGTQIFWKEIKNNFEHQEFVRLNPQKTGCGIGLIKLPE